MPQFADVRRFSAVALVIVATAGALEWRAWAAARAPGQAPAQTPTFRTSTDAMWVTATAIDREGRLVIDLGRDEFELLVDGVVKPITVFRSDPVPFALAVMFDLSGSLAGSLGTIRRAMIELIGQFRPGDRAIVGSFDTLPSISPRFSSNRETLLQSTAAAMGAVKMFCRGPWAADLRRTRSPGGSAIWDAVACGIDTVASDAETPRRVVVLITDGKDNMSITQQPEVLAFANTYGVMVYVIAMVGTEGLNTGGLRALAEETGGGYVVLNQQEDPTPAFARIAEELRHQYVMGYSASSGKDSGTLEVRVKRPGVNARGRRATMTVLPVANSVTEAIASQPDNPPAYSEAPIPIRGETVFDRAARNMLRPEDLPQLSLRGMRVASSDVRRLGLGWIKAGGPSLDRTRRLQVATFVLDFLSFQDQVSYWSNNSAPAADLLDWASSLIRTGPPDAAERLWHLAGVALLQRFGAAGPLQSYLASARERFPEEPQFKLAEAVAADMQLWPQERDERGFVVEPKLLLTIFARYNALLTDTAIGQEAHLRLGYFELLRGQRDQALAHFDQAGAPQDQVLQYTLHLFRGQALMAAGRHDDAIASFRRAVDVVPYAQSATIALGSALVTAGYYNEAEAIISRMMSMPSSPFDPWTIYSFPAWRYWAEWREALRKAITP